MFSALAGAVGDLADGVKLAPLWMTLGWDQTLSRFRRTVLGPFWLSANLLSLALALSLVYGAILGSDYRATFANVVTGILAWSLLGGAFSEASGLFVGSAGTIMAQKLPLSFHVLLMMQRLMVNFAAQLVTAWVVLAVMRLGAPPTWQFLVGLPITVITSSLFCLCIAIVSVRFRDIGQLVANMMGLLFFLTPVFWLPSQMGGRQRLMVEYNPLAHLLEIVREPLIGRLASRADWIWSLGSMVVAAGLVLILLALYRKRVVFWL